jgi:hypothetical protein
MTMEFDLFFDVLTIAIPVLVIGYWARHEPDGIWQTLMETHQSNLDDIEEQETQL